MNEAQGIARCPVLCACKTELLELVMNRDARHGLMIIRRIAETADIRNRRSASGARAARGLEGAEEIDIGTLGEHVVEQQRELVVLLVADVAPHRVALRIVVLARQEQ